jgi:hypothetical protein
MSDFDSQWQDVVVLLDAVPSPAADASKPFVVANERRVAVAYRIAETDFERFGPFDDSDDPSCVAVFSDAVFHQFGPPNNEDLHAHPLASQGLRGLSVHEVMNSSLVMDAWGSSQSREGLRHFVFTLGDTTLECVSADCTVAGIYGSSEIAVREAFSLCG